MQVLVFIHSFSQALWKTLRSPVDNIAHVAFRVLGKFGGGNRKMLREPQKVCFKITTGLDKVHISIYVEIIYIAIVTYGFF